MGLGSCFTSLFARLAFNTCEDLYCAHVCWSHESELLPIQDRRPLSAPLTPPVNKKKKKNAYSARASFVTWLRHCWGVTDFILLMFTPSRNGSVWSGGTNYLKDWSAGVPKRDSLLSQRLVPSTWSNPFHSYSMFNNNVGSNYRFVIVLSIFYICMHHKLDVTILHQTCTTSELLPIQLVHRS